MARRKAAPAPDPDDVVGPEDEPTSVPAGDGEPDPPADNETQPEVVELDPSYVPRPYVEAMTDEQREVLVAADQMPAEPEEDAS